MFGSFDLTFDWCHISTLWFVWELNMVLFCFVSKLMSEHVFNSKWKRKTEEYEPLTKAFWIYNNRIFSSIMYFQWLKSADVCYIHWKLRSGWVRKQSELHEDCRKHSLTGRQLNKQILVTKTPPPPLTKRGQHAESAAEDWVSSSRTQGWMFARSRRLNLAPPAKGQLSPF